MIFLDATTKIEVYALIWAGLLLFALARNGGKHGTVGLPLAFIASYMSGHAGALVHLVDGYDHTASAYLRAMNYTRETVADGFEASCLAMLAASVGFTTIDCLMSTRGKSAKLIRLDLLRKGSLILMFSGMSILVIGTALSRLSLTLPGLQAVISAIQNLFVVGACGWVLHRYLVAGSHKAMVWAGGLALAMPAVLLVSTAILADSIVLAIMITSFYLTLPAPRAGRFWSKLLVLGLSVSCALIFAVFYLQARDALRDIVWHGGGVEQGIESITRSAQSFELSSVGDADAMSLLDARLNQNVFVGLAIEKLRSLPDTYENGATIELALLAWIPRLFWPDKPERGGSSFIAKHTGLQFVEGTTFGAGPIFEFYVNFGYSGVLLGFLILGLVVRALDIAALRALVGAELGGFAQYLLAGVALLQPLADLFFLITGIATALLVGWGQRALLKYLVSSPAAGNRQLRG